MRNKTTIYRRFFAGVMVILLLQLLCIKSYHHHRFFDSFDDCSSSVSIHQSNADCAICHFTFYPCLQITTPSLDVVCKQIIILPILYHCKDVYGAITLSLLRAPPISMC